MEPLNTYSGRRLSLMIMALLMLTPGALLIAQEPGIVVAADTRVQGRSYLFRETGETIPYALFVPSNYDPAKSWPLIVGLHGGGRPYDWLMGYEGIIDFAQRDGYIMVTPLGYHPLGFYGNLLPTDVPRTERFRPLLEGLRTLPPNISELSERDVMNVLAIVRNDLNVDSRRVYVWGHSMGGGGALYLAAKYPDVWAGVAAAAPYRPSNFVQLTERFRQVPTLVLQGDADDTVPVAETREWVAKMKELRMEVLYVQIARGEHTPFISKNQETLSKIFSFFNIVRKDQRSAVK
jgi:predicted peptidase